MSAYDYIIVGAGSAGSVLAARLSENGRHTVLVLEAGGRDRQLWLNIPIGYGRSFHDPHVNWMYETEPEPGLDNRVGYWPRGKVLGGSSAINAMVYMRGLAADFDAWRALGNPGWGWDDVLPYFARSEHFHGDAAGDAASGYGRAGPLHVSDVSRQCHPLCEAFFRASVEAGLARSPGLNGPNPEGVGYYPITAWKGRRISTARAYLKPAMRRRNLRIETAAHVHRLVFAGSRAVGVEYGEPGALRKAEARREITLAAGAVNSPQLLQLSGIGPPELLNRYGIPLVRANRAVGAHLQDHLCIDHLYRSRRPTLNSELGTWPGRIRVALRYLLFRQGPLAISVNQAGGLVRSRDDLPQPNLQLYFSPLSYTRAPPGTRALMQPDPFPGFLLSAQPCRPMSRGEIRIRSPDPLAAPEIRPGSLACSHDLEELLEGTKFLRRLAAAPSLAAIIAEELLPGPAVDTDQEMCADIRRRASTVFHPVGTCRMSADPESSVVGHTLKVHGIQGLRVIDASIFPAITSANTNAPVIMVAERGADLILHDDTPATA